MNISMAEGSSTPDFGTAISMTEFNNNLISVEDVDDFDRRHSTPMHTKPPGGANVFSSHNQFGTQAEVKEIRQKRSSSQSSVWAARSPLASPVTMPSYPVSSYNTNYVSSSKTSGFTSASNYAPPDICTVK